MKRILILFIILNSYLFAYKYNEFLLKTQCILFPKILLLDKKIDEKTVNGKIKIAIIFEKEDLNTALFIKSLISSYYDSRLENYKLEIDVVPVDEFIRKNGSYSSLYFLKISKEKIENIKKTLKKGKIVTFVYDKNDLKYGFLFSIDLEKNPIIYINKKAINQNFDFIPQLYQLVRLVDNV